MANSMQMRSQKSLEFVQMKTMKEKIYSDFNNLYELIIKNELTN